MSSPGRLASGVLHTVSGHKRRRNDSDDCLEERPKPSRLRTQQQREGAIGGIGQTDNKHAAAGKPGLGQPGRAAQVQRRSGPALSPAAFSTPGVHAAYNTGRYGAGWAAAAAAAAPVSAVRGSLTLYNSIASQPRRHGPTSGFRSTPLAATPVSPPSLVRQPISACPSAAHAHACMHALLVGCQGTWVLQTWHGGPSSVCRGQRQPRLSGRRHCRRSGRRARWREMQRCWQRRPPRSAQQRCTS